MSTAAIGQRIEMRLLTASRVRAEICEPPPQRHRASYPGVVTAPDPALTKALTHLSMQVNPDNVLAVYKAFRDHADALEKELKTLSIQTKIGLCGLDPVSADAAGSFGGKVGQLLELHWAHQRELVVAAEHLRRIALAYGHTEAEIERSLGTHAP